MLDIQQKRKLKNFIYNKFTIFILFLLVLLLIHSTWRVYLKKRESIEILQTSQQRLSELEYRNNELDSKISKLNTRSGIEEEIRSKFSVAKENENVVIVLREDVSTGTEEVISKGFWGKIKDLFR